MTNSWLVGLPQALRRSSRCSFGWRESLILVPISALPDERGRCGGVVGVRGAWWMWKNVAGMHQSRGGIKEGKKTDGGGRNNGFLSEAERCKGLGWSDVCGGCVLCVRKSGVTSDKDLNSRLFWLCSQNLKEKTQASLFLFCIYLVDYMWKHRWYSYV